MWWPWKKKRALKDRKPAKPSAPVRTTRGRSSGDGSEDMLPILMLQNTLNTINTPQVTESGSFCDSSSGDFGGCGDGGGSVGGE